MVLSQLTTPNFYIVYFIIGLVLLASLSYFGYIYIKNALINLRKEEEKENKILNAAGFTEEYIENNYQSSLPILIDKMEEKFKLYKERRNIIFKEKPDTEFESIEWQYISLCKHLNKADTWKYIFKKLLLIDIKLETI